MVDCFDKGKEPILNMIECQEASLELGIVYNTSVNWAGSPKKCFSNDTVSWWNTHPTGGSKPPYKRHPICKKLHGKYISSHCMKVYYVNINNINQKLCHKD